MTDLWFTAARLTIRLSKHDNADGVSLIEHRMARGFAVPLHLHADEDESFYVLAGIVRMQVADDVQTLRTGDALTVHSGVPHSFLIVSDEARFLTITTGRFEDVIRAMARPAADEGLPPQDEPTPEQIDALVTACREHGIEFVGPSVP